MKFKKYFLAFVTLLGLSYFSAHEASANTIDPNEDLLSQVQFFDGEGNLIPYTTEEIKDLVRFETNNTSSIEKYTSIMPLVDIQRTYDSGAFSFLDYYYLNKGNSFKNPIDIRMTAKGTARDFRLTVTNSLNGIKAESVKMPGGWTGTAHLSLTNIPRASYTFRFDNLDITTITMTNASLIYTY